MSPKTIQVALHPKFRPLYPPGCVCVTPWSKLCIPRGEIAIEFVTQHFFYSTDCCCLKYFLVTRMCHVHFSHQKDHHHSVCAKSMNQHKVQLFHEKSIFIVKIQDYSPKCWSLKVNFQTELRTLLNLTAACHLFCWTHFRSRFIDVLLHLHQVQVMEYRWIFLIEIHILLWRKGEKWKNDIDVIHSKIL